MNLSLRLFHFETWATFFFVTIAIGLLLVGYSRNRSLAFLSLAVGDILFLTQVATRYVYWLGTRQSSAVVQLSLTGLLLLGCVFTTFGIAALCLHRSPPTI